MSSDFGKTLFREIAGHTKGKLEDVLVGDHICTLSMDRLHFENLKLKVGMEEAKKTIHRLCEEVEKEKATKRAILSSWKYSMIEVRKMNLLDGHVQARKIELERL